MRARKYSFNQTSEIDLGTKHIFKYPTPTKELDIAKMVVDGRHPIGKTKFIIEHDCQFVIYVTKGEGKITAGKEVFNVKVGDVVFVPTNNRFAVEGKLEYITVDTPSFYPEQSEELEY